MKIFAYLRVSTVLQNEARQVDALAEYQSSTGITVDHVYLDKMSGKNFNRPQYQEMVAQLQPGDLIIIKSLDRLGRDYREILEQWRTITKEKGADIVVIDMPLLDTRFGKDLVGTLITDLVLSLLSFTANQEYDFIKARAAEGIAAAKARGVRFGAAPKDRGEQYPELVEQWEMGTISAREASRKLGVAHTTFLKWVRSSAPTTILGSDVTDGGLTPVTE